MFTKIKIQQIPVYLSLKLKKKNRVNSRLLLWLSHEKIAMGKE